ncbi:MAG: CPBP family intramembrane glutamic endopeptidase [Anaerolineaceae bacterium]
MNTSNLSEIEPANQKTHKIIAWCLLGGLLFLRLPFLTGIAMFAFPIWLMPVYEIGTYLLIALLIFWERNHLADFHIDKLSLIIIIVFKPFSTVVMFLMRSTRNPLAFPNWPGFSFWLIAIGLIIALRCSRTSLPGITKNSLAWLGLGLVFGLILDLLLMYPLSFQINTSSQFSVQKNLMGIPLNFLNQISSAAIDEEPLFRGFLWGMLLKSGWKNVWIWLFQTALFVIGHLYYLNGPLLSLWLYVPIAGLVFGALVWRSKTIASSMATHALSNSLGLVSWQIIARLRL